MAILTEPSPATLASPEAFRSFYLQALPRVYSYLFHRCAGVAAAAEDLTQETFLAAVTEIKRGKQVADPIGWIMGIARHKWLDQLRRREREQRRLALVWRAAQLDDQDARLEWEGESSRDRALAALNALPEGQRAALALRYFDGLAVADVARSLGRSVHATESLLARGRENFKLNFVRNRS